MNRLLIVVGLGVIALGVSGRHHPHHPRGHGYDPEPAPALASLDEMPASPFDFDEPAAPAPEAATGGRPAWFPRDREQEEALAGPDARGVRVLVGPLAADEGKARAELRRKVDRAVNDWLAGGSPMAWTPPTAEVDRMIRATYVQPVAEGLSDVSKDLDDLYTLYRAGARVDFSAARKARLLRLHEHDLVRERMLKGGGVLAFVLVVLGILAGYIRADESTKGYYTNRLRMLAAAGVGAAGVVVYRLLA